MRHFAKLGIVDYAEGWRELSKKIRTEDFAMKRLTLESIFSVEW